MWARRGRAFQAEDAAGAKALGQRPAQPACGIVKRTPARPRPWLPDTLAFPRPFNTAGGIIPASPPPPNLTSLLRVFG